ncbi:MAG: hypothetical protein GC192_11085 [Bacteroidetes bacterium]|nr:hypothetical protein [Bacteroidota bacterium]
MRLLHILSVSALFLLPKPASANLVPEFEQQLFIESWASMAVEQMRLYGIPASITLAQAIVESGWGNGYVAQRANNYFCIKANNGWTGPIVKAQDDDPDSSSFRQYLTIEESFHDHSKFLLENQRYQSLFRLGLHDYKGWAYGLKSAGYATKVDYAEYLISTIEKYGLYLYDYAIPASQVNTPQLPTVQQPDIEAMPAPVPDAINGFQIIDNQTDSGTSKAENRQAMPAPGYHLDGATIPATSVEQPSVEIPSVQSTVKINLILPKAASKFDRR